MFRRTRRCVRRGRAGNRSLLAVVGVLAGLILLVSGCTHGSYSGSWAPGVRPRVMTIAQHFGVRGSTYPGHDPSMGYAADFMVGSHAQGQAIANWVIANRSWLHVHYVCWWRHIWNVQRAGQGWRLLSNGGSATANHMNHVHVSFW
jgi:hypothetical protein